MGTGPRLSRSISGDSSRAARNAASLVMAVTTSEGPICRSISDCGTCDHAGVGEQEFPVGQRMGERVAPHDGGPQIGGALEGHLAGAVAMLGRDVGGARSLQTLLDRRRQWPRPCGVGKGGEPGVLILRGQRRDRAELSRERLGDLGGVSGHDHRRGVDATAAPIVGNGGDHQVDELRPAARYRPRR